MICQRCLYRAAAHTSFAKSPIPATHFPQFNGRAAQHTTQRFCRTFTSKPPASQQAVSPAASTQAKGRQPGGPPSATSTSAAQPFSTPFTPSAPPLAANASKPSPIPASSVPAGTPLRGLNYLKNHSEPLALEDSEYPAWLWKCLDGVGEKGKTDGGDGEGEGDLFCTCISSRCRRLPFTHVYGFETTAC